MTDDRRPDRLLREMTPAEKVAQLTAGAVPGPGGRGPAETGDHPAGVLLVHGTVSPERVLRDLREAQQRRERTRLGIPALTVSVGVPGSFEPVRGGSEMSVAACWDTALVEREAARWAAQMRACGVLASFGAVTGLVGPDHPDPMLGAAMAAAEIRGAQGGPGYRIGPEHVAVGVRLGVPQDGSWHERTVRSVLLSVARASVRAGACLVMPTAAGNAGVPGHADPWLLRRVLRDEWGFRGAVLAAPGGIGDLVTRYRVAAGAQEAVAAAVEAGVDVAWSSGRDPAGGPARAGFLPPWLLDDAVLAVLRLKQRLGLLDGVVPWPRTARVPPPERADGAGSAVLLTDPAGAIPVRGPVRIVSDGRDDGPGPAGSVPDRLAAALATDGADVSVGGDLGTAPAGSTVVVPAVDPGGAAALAARSIASGRPCVVLLLGGRTDGLAELVSTTATVVLCWAPPVSSVDLAAGVLTGRCEPRGRLPAGIVPAGATEGGIPLGTGSGYASGFRYTRLRLNPAALVGRETVRVRCLVTNTGDTPGSEVVQVYIERPSGPTADTGRRLVGFATVHLPAGQGRGVTVDVPAAHLGTWDHGMRHVLWPGPVRILVGRSAADLPLRATLIVHSSGAVDPEVAGDEPDPPDPTG